MFGKWLKSTGKLWIYMWIYIYMYTFLRFSNCTYKSIYTVNICTFPIGTRECPSTLDYSMVDWPLHSKPSRTGLRSWVSTPPPCPAPPMVKEPTGERVFANLQSQRIHGFGWQWWKLQKILRSQYVIRMMNKNPTWLLPSLELYWQQW